MTVAAPSCVPFATTSATPDKVLEVVPLTVSVMVGAARGKYWRKA